MLTQKIKQLSPFAETGHYVVDDNDTAMVWLWDESRRRHAQEESAPGRDVAAEQLKVVPETVLYSRLGSGGHEQQLASGVDEQRWHDGVLIASRWHPDGESSVVGPIAAVNDPWIEQIDDAGAGLSEQLVWRLVVVILALVLLLQLGWIAGLGIQENRLEKEVAEQRALISGVLSSREVFRDIKQTNSELLTWFSTPSQLDLIATVDELVPETAEIRRWKFQEGLLEVVIHDTALNNRAYIESLNGEPRFSAITVEPGTAANTAVIRLSVDVSAFEEAR